MVVHISPSDDDIGETVCSLSFAKRARSIEYSKELSEVSNRDSMCNCLHLEEMCFS